MLKKTITYKDFNGVEHTEDFFFHLSEVELIELEVSEREGFGELLQRIIDEKDAKNLVGIFRKFILEAYGEKSEDGKRFIKSDQLREEFSQTAAYPALYMELATNAQVAADFMTGILPAELATKLALEDHKPKKSKQ